MVLENKTQNIWFNIRPFPRVRKFFVSNGLYGTISTKKGPIMATLDNALLSTFIFPLFCLLINQGTVSPSSKTTVLEKFRSKKQGCLMIVGSDL